MEELETARLRIRRFAPSDAEGARGLFSDAEAMRFLALRPLSDPEASAERTRAWARDGLHYAVVKKDDGAFVGYVSVRPDSEEEREDTRELAFAACGERRRLGYTSEAVSAVLKALKNEGVRFVRACCFAENEASKRFLEKAGFEFLAEGTFETREGVRQTLEYRAAARES